MLASNSTAFCQVDVLRAHGNLGNRKCLPRRWPVEYFPFVFNQIATHTCLCPAPSQLSHALSASSKGVEYYSLLLAQGSVLSTKASPQPTQLRCLRPLHNQRVQIERRYRDLPGEKYSSYVYVVLVVGDVVVARFSACVSAVIG